MDTVFVRKNHRRIGEDWDARKPTVKNIHVIIYIRNNGCSCTSGVISTYWTGFSHLYPHEIWSKMIFLYDRGLMKSGCVSCALTITFHQNSLLMYNHLYLGLDAHTRTCTLASINDKGKVVTTKTFSTSEYSLIDQIRQVPAKKKSLMLEESSLAVWLTRTYVRMWIRVLFVIHCTMH